MMKARMCPSRKDEFCISWRQDKICCGYTINQISRQEEAAVNFQPHDAILEEWGHTSPIRRSCFPCSILGLCWPGHAVSLLANVKRFADTIDAQT